MIAENTKYPQRKKELKWIPFSTFSIRAHRHLLSECCFSSGPARPDQGTWFWSNERDLEDRFHV